MQQDVEGVVHISFTHATSRQMSGRAKSSQPGSHVPCFQSEVYCVARVGCCTSLPSVLAVKGQGKLNTMTQVAIQIRDTFMAVDGNTGLVNPHSNRYSSAIVQQML